MTVLGTKSKNFNPIGIFNWCTSRDQVVDYSINKAQEVFIKKGYRVFVPNNPDTGGDGDFIVEKYPEVSIVSCKGTTQTTRTKIQNQRLILEQIVNLRIIMVKYVLLPIIII